MENKVLVRVIVPELDETFDVFLPINELVWKVKKLIVKSVSDLMGIPVDIKKEYILLDKNSSTIYANNDIIVDTNIRNGSELVLVSKS